MSSDVGTAAARDEQAATAPLPDPAPTLFWVAVYLVELAWGGAEEGGWWFEEAALVTAPDIYAALDVLPACCLTEAEAEAVAARMRAGLPALNDGRPPLSAMASQGLYDVRVAQAGTLPSCLPVCPPRYE